MKKNKLVSVILPFYNSKKFLKRSIDSILNQTYQNLEIILVDDCSNDGSYNIARKYLLKDKRFRLFKTKKNSNTVAVPRNIGINKATGEYVTFLDADDYWHNKKIEYQINNIGKNFFCSTACDYKDEKSKKKSGFFLNIIRIFLQIFVFNRLKKSGYHWFYLYNPVIVSSVFIKKSILKKTKLFSPDPNIREDLSLWLSLFRYIGNNFIFLKNISLTITRTPMSMSSNKVEEFCKIIRTLTSDLLFLKNFKKFPYIILGVFLRSGKFFIELNINKIKKNFFLIFVAISIFVFIIFYTPLFWYLGNPLLKNTIVNEKGSNYIISYSGDKFSHFAMNYLNRYNDILNIVKNKKNIQKIYLLGTLNNLPQQKVIEKLLNSDDISSKKIEIIFMDFHGREDDILNFQKNYLEGNDKINLIITTSPYHTLRSFNNWKKNTDYNIAMWKSVDWPMKNNFFEYAKNKKIILYEGIIVLYNKILGRL